MLSNQSIVSHSFCNLQKGENINLNLIAVLGITLDGGTSIRMLHFLKKTGENMGN